MKANRGHVVPLCPRAIRIVERCAELRLPGCPIIFPGVRGKQPMSDMTMSKLLKEMGQPYTAHGFRSSFWDWVSEATNHPSAVPEAALAHTDANKPEADYQRGNIIKNQRGKMDEWACLVKGQNASTTSHRLQP